MASLRNLLARCALWGLLVAATSQATVATTLTADIAPQPLAQALVAFANQTGLQLVYVSELATAQQSKGARAGQSLSEALAQLLDGTGLRFEFLNARTVRIFAVAAVLMPAPSETPPATARHAAN